MDSMKRFGLEITDKIETLVDEPSLFVGYFYTLNENENFRTILLCINLCKEILMWISGTPGFINTSPQLWDFMGGYDGKTVGGLRLSNGDLIVSDIGE